MTHSNNNSIKFLISQDEWQDLPLAKRERIKAMLLDYGYDISAIDGDEDDE